MLKAPDTVRPSRAEAVSPRAREILEEVDRRVLSAASQARRGEDRSLKRPAPSVPVGHPPPASRAPAQSPTDPSLAQLPRLIAGVAERADRARTQLEDLTSALETLARHLGLDLPAGALRPPDDDSRRG